MSEKELKNQETTGKLVVFIPMVLLMITMLLLSSCSSTSYTLCDAYASVETKNQLK